MAWRGSISRSIVSAARSVRTAPSAAPLRPSPLRIPRSPSSFSTPRRLGVLGCTQSLLPVHGTPSLLARLAHPASARACCELSQGTLTRTCQDR